MRKHNIGPSISTNTVEFFGKNFSTVNAGASYALESFPTLYRRTLSKLKGTFAEEELGLIIDVFNKENLTPSIAGQHLTVYCDDGLALDGNKRKVDPQKLNEKLYKLSIFDAAVLEVWAVSFYVTNAKGKGVDKYVNQLK